MKKGDVLIAIDPCVMRSDNRVCLTVGNEYPITGISQKSITVIDDNSDMHEFTLQHLDEYFKLKEPERVEIVKNDATREMKYEKALHEINELLWNTLMTKGKSFGRNEGYEIMKIIERNF